MSRTVEMRETFAKAILLECVYGHLDHNIGEEVVAFRHGLSLLLKWLLFHRGNVLGRSSIQALSMIL